MEDTEVVEAVATEPVQEKTLTQSQVNDIVKREKAQAIERAKRELKTELDAAMKTSSSSMGGVQPDYKAIKDEILNDLKEMGRQHQEAAQKKRQEAEAAEEKQAAEEVANKFFMKLGAGKEQFSDFEEVMKDFEIAAFPRLAFMAADMDNTAHIMYELANNPSKLAQLQLLAQSSPKLAKKEMEKLSQSIAQNQEAKANNASAPEPLSRLKSSTVGADSGKMTVRDYKNEPWLKV